MIFVPPVIYNGYTKRGIIIMMLRFGTNLEYLRKLNKMEQKDVAKIVNKSVSTISAWERAKREPTVADVYLLALYFKVDIETLCFANITDIKPVR